MKSTTVVNGVTLTREQVETALRDLNAPEQPTYIPGDFVTISGYPMRHVVVSHDLRRILQSYYDTLDKNRVGVWTVSLDYGTVYVNDPKNLRKAVK